MIYIYIYIWDPFSFLPLACAADGAALWTRRFTILYYDIIQKENNKKYKKRKKKEQ